MENSELYHHGILGMKWGVRRYQNKNGSLTKLGKRKRKQESQKEEPAKKKAYSDMSDDEIKSKINRMRLEKEAYMLEKDVAALTPKKVSSGKRFASSLMKDVIGPAARNAGQTLLTDFLKKKGQEALGLTNKESDDIYSQMQKELKNYNTKKAYDKMKEEIDPKAQAKRDKQEKKAEKEADKQDKKAEKKAEKEAAKEERKAEKEAAKEERKAEKEEWDDVDSQVWDDFTSKASDYFSKREKNNKYDDVVDGDFIEINDYIISDAKSYVSNSNLLSLPVSTMLALPAPREEE